MSLLRALRAYVGLGPEEDYEERYAQSSSRSARGTKDGSGADRVRSRATAGGGYLDDYGVGSVSGRSGGSSDHDVDEEDEIIDIRTARIDARMADGSEPPPRRANQSRQRIGDRNAHRKQSLSENEELLEQIVTTSSSTSGGPRLADESSALTIKDGGRQEENSNADTSAEVPGEEFQGAVVRSIDSARSRPRTLNPESFADAKHIGDEFKRGTPVVINLQGLDRDLVRRLVDFASGICYALDGNMEKLAPQVFLLTPDGLDVSDSDRRRIEERGYAR